jgi:hypothetical protein
VPTWVPMPTSGTAHKDIRSRLNTFPSKIPWNLKGRNYYWGLGAGGRRILKRNSKTENVWMWPVVSWLNVRFSDGSFEYVRVKAPYFEYLKYESLCFYW